MSVAVIPSLHTSNKDKTAEYVEKFVLIMPLKKPIVIPELSEGKK